MNRNRYLSMLMATVAVAVVYACGGAGEAANPADSSSGPAITLGASDVATVARASLREGIPLSGVLEPRVNIVVGAPIAEQVAEMFVEEGVPVRQGQPLARFRDDVLRAAEASASADAARARLAVRLALTDSARSETLFREGAIARRDYDNALIALESSRAQLALAESQLASVTDRLHTATLRAPAAGIVSQRHAQAGDRVDFGKPVISIVDTRVLQLAASVEARWLASLRPGREVVLVASGGDSLAGRIARINPIADPATRQVRIYVEVPNPRGRLVGGLYVSGLAIVREVANAVSVPRRAIRRSGAEAQPVVYVVREGRIRAQSVRLGVEDTERGMVQVTQGLAGGETVVVGPVEGLADGMRVEIVAAPAAPRAAVRD